MKAQRKPAPVILNALIAQHAYFVIGLLRIGLGRIKVNDAELIHHCEVAVYHLESLIDQLDDAFMIATCQSLIQAFRECIAHQNLLSLQNHYRLPARYFIERFGTRELVREFLNKREKVMV